MSAFNTFLSDDVKPDNTQGSVTGTGLFNNFLSDDVKNKPIKNEFKIYNQPDDKFLLRNIELDENKFGQFLSEDVKLKENVKLFSDDNTDFGLNDAFVLGLTDTIRGVTQFAGGKKVLFMDEDLETQQARLNQALQGEGGGLIAAAYFGGAILDPLTWLIPVLRGKSLYKLAFSGGISGGLAGALGYVDENSLFDTRSKQALGGALGGAIVSPIVGKTLQIAGVKKLKKSLQLDKEGFSDEAMEALPASQKVKIRAPGEEDIFVGTEKQIQRSKRKRKISGRGAVDFEVRKRIPILKTEKVDGRPGRDSNRNFILRGPREFFKTILGGYVKPVSTAVQTVTKPIVEGVGAGKKLYTTKIGKPAFDYFTKGAQGGEVGTGLAGGLYGFAMPEEDGDITKRFSRAALGFMMGFGGVKFAKKTQVPQALKDARAEKLGMPVEEDLSIASFLAKGLVDGYKVPKVIKKLETEDLEGLKNKIELSFLRIFQEANQLSSSERKVLYNLLEGDIKFDVVPKDLARIAKKARGNITKITQMYIDAGLITEETALRNIERYIKRSYGGKDISKIGSELRARGVIETITPNEWMNKYSKTKAFKVDDAGKFVPLEDHRGWELFGNVQVKKFEKAERATEDKVQELIKAGKGDEASLNIRWEYTKQERLGMSEIEDGAFAIMETGRLMAQTLPRYKFYGDIAAQAFTKTSPTADEIQKLNLVQVPESKRPGTIQFTYGKLAGKFIPREVYENIFQINKIAEGPKTPFFRGYRALNQIWKASKTAWNPTVHVNNMVSNLVLLDLVDGSATYLPAAVKAFVDAENGKSVKVLEEAANLGVFANNVVKRELDVLDPKKLKPSYYKADPNKTVFENGLNMSSVIYKDLVLKEKFGLQTLSNFYALEDSIFRLALYMDRKAKGYKTTQAAQDARKSFIDYNIQAPGINALRNLPTPFLAYTYRVIPILAETAVVRPWKFAKYAVLGYMLNNLGELLGEGDPVAERAAMSEEKQGRIGGLPILPHRNIKLPTQDGSAYIDVTRFVPGGDIFDLNSGTIPLVPQPLQANFGIAGEVLFPMLGFDLFRGDKIKGQGVSEFDDFKVRAQFGLKKMIPNFPFVPGSYSTERIEAARRDDSPLSRGESELLAFFNSIGFKVNIADISKLRTTKSFEFRRKVNGLKEKIRIEGNKLSRGKITEDEFNKRVDEINSNFAKIRDRYVEAIGMPINYQEAVPLSEYIPTIGAAIKEQTKKLFQTKEKKKDKSKFEQFLTK